MTRELGNSVASGWLSRMGNWLRQTIRKERAADAQWREDERRKRAGQMGEDIQTENEAADRTRAVASPEGAANGRPSSP